MKNVKITTLKVIEAHELTSVISGMDTSTRGELLDVLGVTTGDARYTLLTAQDILETVKDKSEYADLHKELSSILANSTAETDQDKCDANPELALYVNLEYL